LSGKNVSVDQLRLRREGLPIGRQIIGRWFDDLGVLAVARAFESIRSFAARPGRSRLRRKRPGSLKASGVVVGAQESA
jgi:Asp-tRNA(Asn)/Glu-tRNA(Gln) amidotransferase A subunit family amidase